MRLVLASGNPHKARELARDPARLGDRAARDGPRASSRDGLDLRRERAREGPVRPGGPRPRTTSGCWARTRGSRWTRSAARRAFSRRATPARARPTRQTWRSSSTSSRGRPRAGRRATSASWWARSGRRARSGRPASSRADRRGALGLGRLRLRPGLRAGRRGTHGGRARRRVEGGAQPSRARRARLRGRLRSDLAGACRCPRCRSSHTTPRPRRSDAPRSSRACPRTSSPQLAKVTEDLEVPAGKVLCREGEPAQEFFVIIEGEAEVTKGGQSICDAGPRRLLRRDRAHRGHPANGDRDGEDAAPVLRAPRQAFWSMLDHEPGVERKHPPRARQARPHDRRRRALEPGQPSAALLRLRAPVARHQLTSAPRTSMFAIR